MSVDDPVRDLQRVRMPNQQDIFAAVDTMSRNVLLDRDISRQELRLEAPMVQRVVFGEQLPSLPGVTGGQEIAGGPPSGPPNGPTAQVDPNRGR